MTTKETPEPQPVDNWEFFTDGAYWDMCAVRPVGDRDFNSPNLFHVLNLKEGERLASLLNSHCAYSAQPTPPPIDVKALKKSERRVDYPNGLSEQGAGRILGWNACIDHLYSAGYLRAPLTKIEGLSDAIWVLEDPTDERNEYINKVLIAAKAYLKASEV